MDIKKEIQELIKESLSQMNLSRPNVAIEIPKDKKNGDYATSIAMQLAKVIKKDPMTIAKQIEKGMPANNIINKIKIEKPGFINFFIDKKHLFNIINEIIELDNNFGRSDLGNNKTINVEFASVNPTGVLHLGHARGAAYGDNLSRLLEFVGFNVTKEYYINDGGNQIDNLGISIKERYRGICGELEKMPADGYFGKEIIEIAQEIYDEYEDTYLNEEINFFRELGVNKLINRIKDDLEKFRIIFDVWTSEKIIRETGKIEESLEILNKLDKTYTEEGALWLKSTEYGDEKDRVLIKDNGDYTYLAPDIAYHLDKFNRGHEFLIDVLGADHHGYVQRLKASIEALGYNGDKLEVKIVQMVRMLKGKEEIKMSKRTGNVISINDLLEEVEVDATRYFFAMRHIDAQMDFDIELATKKTNENPFYYVGYAHARICSILNTVKEIGYCQEFETLDSEYAYNILGKINEFKDVVKTSAIKRTPHIIANYVYDLANLFHIYYAHEKILTEDEKPSNERILLIKAVKIVIKNALSLIGVEAPEKM